MLDDAPDQQTGADEDQHPMGGCQVPRFSPWIEESRLTPLGRGLGRDGPANQSQSGTSKK
jgi:hypothetical protein